MELRSPAGDTLQITIGGYQFPDAHDPAQRYSWHMVQGTASSNGTTWNFHWPALTCDEWALLSIWLRRVARLLSTRRTSQPSGHPRCSSTNRTFDSP